MPVIGSSRTRNTPWGILEQHRGKPRQRHVHRYQTIGTKIGADGRTNIAREASLSSLLFHSLLPPIPKTSSTKQDCKTTLRVPIASTNCLVLVALDEEGLVRGRLGASHVLAEVGLGVGLRTCLQLILGCSQVLGLALPCLEGRLLESTTVRERQRPTKAPKTSKMGECKKMLESRVHIQ